MKGNLFGPLAFNIFSNDLLLLAQDLCDTYNYANDNSFGISGKYVKEVNLQVKRNLIINIRLVDSKYFQANLDKFQFILHDKIIRNAVICMNELIDLKSQNEVKLLCIKIDATLSFSQHINELCRKAERHMYLVDCLKV